MIRLAEVTKEYTGAGGWLFRASGTRALDGITLDIPPGAALGIVGPNGAGKSTLIRLLLGYLRPTAGEVTIGGMPPRQYTERRGIGYVPERIDIPPRWTVRGSLQAYAALGETEHAAERIAEEMERLGIAEIADRRVSALSKGNLQRLALAQALLGDRKLLILDEPTDGMDPEWTARTREILSRWRAADRERVLLFASHNLDEVERVADRVAVLQAGKLREVIELRASSPSPALPAYRLELAVAPAAEVPDVEALFPGALPLDGELPSLEPGLAFRVTAPDLAELNRRLALLLERGAAVRALVPERTSLEQQFRRSLKS